MLLRNVDIAPRLLYKEKCCHVAAVAGRGPGAVVEVIVVGPAVALEAEAAVRDAVAAGRAARAPAVAVPGPAPQGPAPVLAPGTGAVQSLCLGVGVVRSLPSLMGNQGMNPTIQSQMMTRMMTALMDVMQKKRYL